MSKKKILLIITGSIAAYKSMDLIRSLVKKNFDVTPILTKGAQEFVTPLLASSLSGNKAFDDLFNAEDESQMGHINLSRQADLIVIAPASANFIAKMADGRADDLALATILAANKKIFLAPAMNEKMWDNKITKDNLDKLKAANIKIIDPETDTLACGEHGKGKMADVEKILEKIENFFQNKDLLKGKNILITGGATFEPIDPVRFIGNNSSGIQAIKIAQILHEMGAQVTFISGNIKQEILLPQKEIIKVKTAEEMFDAVKNNLNEQDVFIACAAVADFKVKDFSKQKIKKTDGENPTLTLEKNPDILDFVGNNEKRPKLVIGFAAESENLIENAKAKLQKKNCDLIVANDIEGGEIFGSNQTKVNFVTTEKIEKLGKISKEELAENLAAKILQFL